MQSMNEMSEFHMPRWHELPDLELYMDQVVSVVERILLPLSQEEEIAKTITPTMINNYVKQQRMDAPVNKKYGRRHLSVLVMICMLKRFLSLNEISEVITLLHTGRSEEEAYDSFCCAIEEELHTVFSGREKCERQFASGDRQVLYAMACTYANLVYSHQVLNEAMEEIRSLSTASAPDEKKEKKDKKEKKEKKEKKKETASEEEA